MVKLLEYVIGREHTPHIVAYNCGCWMCTDTHRFPAFCPEHGRHATAAHEINQAVFESCLVYSTEQRLKKERKPKFKKVGR